MRFRLPTIFFLCAAFALAAGCGAGKFFTPSSGALTVRAQWPAADGSLRQQALPAAGVALRVAVSGEGLDKPLVQKQERVAGGIKTPIGEKLATSETVASAADEMVFTFESVPQGRKTVRATVFDANGREIAAGEVKTKVEPGQITQAAIDVQAISVTPSASPSVDPGLPTASPSVPVGTSPLPSAPAPSATPRTDKPSGELLKPIDFGSARPFAVALDKAGTLWATLDGGLLARRTSGGTTNITTIGDKSFAIAFDSLGRAWIPSGALKTPVVYVVDAQGNTTSKLISYLRAGPRDIAIDAADFIWLPLKGGEVEPKRVVQIWAPLGTVTDIYVGYAPWGVAIDPQGRAWVTNYNDDSISIVSRAPASTSPATKALAAPATITIKTGKGPSGIAISPQGVAWWVAEGDTVQFLDTSNPQGTPTLIDLGGLSTGTGRVAIDPTSGDVWVSVVAANELVQLNSKGEILSVTNVGLEPQGLAVAADGTVFVATGDHVAHVRGVVPPKASDPNLLGPPVKAGTN